MDETEVESMKKQFSLLLFLCVCLAAYLVPASAEDSAGRTGTVPVFEGGEAQPVFRYTNLRDSNYTNDGSDILRFCVYVETDHDTDGDGMADLVEVLVQVPRAAAEGYFRAGVIYDPTPYGAGTVDENEMNSNMVMEAVPFDYSQLYAPGKKRTPEGSRTTLEAAAEANPDSWNYTVPYSNKTGYSYARNYDFFLVRGFAVVEAGGIGTFGSEGFELCGFDLERDAHKCVVEWLTGDRIAYTNPYHNLEIKADWCNGNVAMTGCSYGGTLPFEVAVTGVKGLKTIIPFAGIASWYDYTNSQGAARAISAVYASHLAYYNSGAAFLDDDWTVINKKYSSFLWQLAQDQEATHGDYADIWAGMDYSLDSSRINCSALIVHGLNDFNVCTKHSDLMARAFARAGQPFKLVLHQDGHNTLNGIFVNGMLWQDIMNMWLSHYLYDVDNGIENMPAVSVQSNVDGFFRTYNTWGEFDYQSFAFDREITPDSASHIDSAEVADAYSAYSSDTDDLGKPLPRDCFYSTLPDNAAAQYVFEVPENYTLYGVPEVRLKISAQNTDKDQMMVTALLIDTIDWKTNFGAFLTKTRLHDRLPKKTIFAMPAGEGLPDTKMYFFVQSDTPAKLVTFGYADLKNPGGGYNGADYTRREEDITAGEYYDYTIYLQPTSYTFQPGHKAVLVITSYDPYITEGAETDFDYSFTIDNTSLELRFPKEKAVANPSFTE